MGKERGLGPPGVGLPMGIFLQRTQHEERGLFPTRRRRRPPPPPTKSATVSSSLM